MPKVRILSKTITQWKETVQPKVTFTNRVTHRVYFLKGSIDGICLIYYKFPSSSPFPRRKK